MKWYRYKMFIYYINSKIPIPISEIPRKMYSLQNHNNYIYIYINIGGWVSLVGCYTYLVLLIRLVFSS